METPKTTPPPTSLHKQSQRHVRKDPGFLALSPEDHRVAEGVNRKVRQSRHPANEADAWRKSQGEQRRGAPSTKTEGSFVALPEPSNSYSGLAT